MIQVSILIVSYNTREMTLECLRSVYEQTDESFEVILADNASSDGSAEAIARQFPQVRLIASSENHGFARANNLAAQEAKGRYILLLNPDTVVLDHGIDRLLAFAREHPEAKLWGGRTVYGDGSLNATSCFARMTLWSMCCRTFGLGALFPRSELLNWENYGRWQRDTVRQVDIITGCFLLIERDVWEQLGGFAPEFFMYAEDADLCLRARKLGARPMVTPEAVIIHHGSASDPVKAEKIAGVFAGKLTQVRRHWGPVERVGGEALFRIIPLMRIAGFSVAAMIWPKRFRDRADTWREVWRRRRQWLPGYIAQD